MLAHIQQERLSNAGPVLAGHQQCHAAMADVEDVGADPGPEGLAFGQEAQLHRQHAAHRQAGFVAAMERLTRLIPEGLIEGLLRVRHEPNTRQANG